MVVVAVVLVALTARGILPLQRLVQALCQEEAQGVMAAPYLQAMEVTLLPALAVGAVVR